LLAKGEDLESDVRTTLEEDAGGSNQGDDNTQPTHTQNDDVIPKMTSSEQFRSARSHRFTLSDGLQISLRHSRTASAVALTPDGKIIASATDYGACSAKSPPANFSGVLTPPPFRSRYLQQNRFLETRVLVRTR
jgi:hypothetical protein